MGELDALTYFNDSEARTVEAIAERIIPGDRSAAGAAKAGVVYYIDRALAGFSTDLQRLYRLGLRELGELCRREHGQEFAELDDDRQDEVVSRLLGPPTAGGGLQFGPSDQPRDGLLHRLLAVIREHTVEGYFCDPAYGGNRNAVGWRLVGFPGAQWGYTAEQMRAGYDARQIPIQTLSDLRARLDDPPDNARYYAEVHDR